MSVKLDTDQSAAAGAQLGPDDERLSPIAIGNLSHRLAKMMLLLDQLDAKPAVKNGGWIWPEALAGTALRGTQSTVASDTALPRSLAIT